MSNIRVIFKDELVLLKRNQSPVIYARAKTKNGWINISTKLREIEEAQEFAIKWHAELQFKEKYNIPINDKSTSQVCDIFLKFMNESENYNDENIRDYGAVVKRYIRPFFGAKGITQISPEDLKAFSAWRNSYWISGPGSELKFIEYKRNGKLIRRPIPDRQRKAPKRLMLEEIVLRKLFNLAAEKGWMRVNQIPHVKLEITTKAKREKTRGIGRPAFTLKEYRLIIKELSGEQSPSIHGTNVRDLFLYSYILLLFTTGLRPGREVDSITWRGVELYVAEEGKKVERTKLHLAHSKTITTPVIVRPLGVSALKRLKQYYRAYAMRNGIDKTEPDLDDKLFMLPTGQWLHSNYFLRKFQKVLTELDLLTDRQGKRRTLYSCRHSFATWLLQGQKVDIYSLAILMRTSVQMIERFYGKVQPEQLAHLLD